MKKILLTIAISLLLYISSYAEKNEVCAPRYGRSDITYGVVWKFIDYDCDGFWDIIMEYKRSSKGWYPTGNLWDCPDRFMSEELPAWE